MPAWNSAVCPTPDKPRPCLPGRVHCLRDIDLLLSEETGLPVIAVVASGVRGSARALIAVVTGTAVTAAASGLGDLAGKVWRIGLMGSACSAENVQYCLNSLDEVLTSMGAPISSGVAVDSANKHLAA